ncbi:ubiquitin-like-specific protease 2A [Chlorella sorokiniana]|uniref:Ubiquitin-like-specific protease 2A n=1 Tax=Chlorella sorokiniana TaxID=3076 RepID=A0A2P6U2Z2_CHLSO|nr:ubiquitin-like-specific protease 2A [Chlorella sorokiniana]|eukprot:PRW60677.1 ubiquitin-like-specific protease 2A [Chlorella sorokiniana]
MPVIENFFRNQFEACLQQEGVTPNLESCLVFGPDTWADLRRLLLPGDGEAAAGKQGYPALERFCREHDAASKQYLLLPLLTPSHGSLLVVCRPEQQPAGGEGQPLLRHRYKMIKQLRAGICLPDEKPELLILHLDSLSGHGGLKGHQPDCTALNRFWQQQLSKKHKGKPCEVQVVVASVPQQGASGLGATFMCTSALYFVANLPPSLTSRQVELLKKYKENVKDLNEPSKHDAKDDSRWYPGFLTTEWYPLNVPEALRKLLLSGIVTGLKAQSGSPAHAALLARASEVRKLLDAASQRQFEMPAQRLSKQLEMKRGRLLAAGRRYWGRVGWVGEGLSGIVMCSKGLWSILLRGNPRTTGLRFEDMQYPSGALPKPADFDLCFGVPLKQGQQPPPFVIHIPLRLLPQAAAAASTDLEERQLEMRFDSKPFISGHRTFWPLENSCWDALCSLLGTSLDECPGGEQHEAGTPDVDGDATPSMPGSPQHTAGTAGTADLADMAAASSLAALHRAGGTALQPTTKGAKRLQTGSDRRGDRRARLTVRGQKYYAGYFPTGAAAAQAEDLMVVWVHCSPTGWPEGWMQSCTGLDHKLNFPFSFHLATHKPLVASLSGCADKDALRKLLQKHLNSGGQQQPDDEELSQQPASQGVMYMTSLSVFVAERL